MINENTVLVLGAGASAPYGFPSGRQLLYEIVRFIDAGESGHAGLERYGHLLDAGFSADELASFRDVLRLSKQPSVDALLEKRPDFVRVGKAAIAAGLIPYEDPEVIRQAEEPKSGWYGYLFEQLNTQQSQFAENTLSIVTLNYDRSLEYFLTLALQFSYGIDDASTVDLMSTIPIVHLYGQLGSLTEGRPYSSELSAEHIQTAANGIRIIHEDTMDPNLVAEALGLMKKADVLAFLGFGYHPLNVERLAEAIGARPGQRVMGTSYGLENNERDRVRRLFGEKLEIDDIGWDCLTYLRKRPVFR